MRLPIPRSVISGLVKDVGPLSTLDGKMLRIVSGTVPVAERGKVTALLGATARGRRRLPMRPGPAKAQRRHHHLLGQDPDRPAAELRARVGVMLQDGGLPPSARPIPLLRHIAGMYQYPRQVDELIARLGIDRSA